MKLLLIFFSLSLSLSSASILYAKGPNASIRHDEPQKGFDKDAFQIQIRQVEAWLGQLTTLESRFTQTSPNSTHVSLGKIYLSRPGKARFEYRSPQQIVLILNEGKLTYYDKSLDQITYARMDHHPIAFLLNGAPLTQQPIKFIGGEETRSSLSLTFVPTEQQEEDTLNYLAMTLQFSKDPFQLSRILRTNLNNETVEVDIIDSKVGITLDDSLFSFSKPNRFNRRRIK